jgi:hypothetical protein
MHQLTKMFIPYIQTFQSSNLNDYSDKVGFEFLCNNEEKNNSCVVHVNISAGEHNPDHLLSQSDPPLFKSLSKNLLDMAEKLKFWSSKFFVRYGDEMIDIPAIVTSFQRAFSS